MLRGGLLLLGVALVIAFVYFRARASAEELAPPVPVAPAQDAAHLEPASATEVQAPHVEGSLERAPLQVARPAANSAGRATLRGRVLTPTGEPCRGATLRFATVFRGRAELEQTRSGPDGRFELVPAEPQVRGDLLATARAHEFAPVARLDVAAGPEELELVLAPAQSFALRFVDAEGVTHEPHEVSFHWMLAGVTREDEDDALGKLRWSPSPVPFRIHVHDASLRDDWLGPFEPSAVGDVLELGVRRRPAVRGIVLAGGAPVAWAEVRLEADGGAELARGAVVSRGSTDAHGAFELRLDEPGTFRVVAFHAGHGRALGPELVCDGERDLEGLTLELDQPPGRIAGRILLPPGRSADELVVQLGTRGRSPREDGSFLLPEVEPGLHTVTIAPGTPGTPRDAWQWPSSDPVSWLGYRPTWKVEVCSGTTSELTLDLATPAPVQLQGRIELGKQITDASTFGHFAAQGVTFRREGVPGVEAQALLDAEGRFALGLATPGAWRLELELMLQRELDSVAYQELFRAIQVTSSWTVNDVLELSRGLNQWELAFTPGALRLRAPGSELELSPGPDLRWQGPGERTIEVRGWGALADSSQGTLTYAEVPPGRVTFQLVPGGATYEATVRSGETSEFVFPESAEGELRAAYDVRTTGLQTPSYLMGGHY